MAQVQNDDEIYRLMVERILDYAIYMLDFDGRVVTWNAGAERIKGYRASEVLGRHFSVCYPRDEVRSGKPERELLAAAAQGRFEEDGWRIRKDGSRFWAHVVITAIRDEAGELLGFVNVMQDLTEQRRVEADLRRSQERFHNAVESAPSAMMMVNRAGRIEMLNLQAECLFGYARDELLGQPVEMLIPERFRRGHPAHRMSFFADPKSRTLAGRELYALRQDGSEFPVEIGLSPIETEEAPMVLATIADITDRKQKEDQIKAALKEKELLLGEVHHRVKNNLQIVQSMLRLQSAKVDDPAVRDILMDCQSRIKSMALIHQTLYQSKDFTKVDFASFLNSLALALINSYRIDSNHIALSIEADQVLLPIDAAVSCGQIVNELLTNALKHAFPEGRRGNISVALSRNEMGEVVLSVTDDGVGIPSSIDMRSQATLGLRLVSLLTDQLKGTLSLQRADPTRFILQFPLKDEGR